MSIWDTMRVARAHCAQLWGGNEPAGSSQPQSCSKHWMSCIAYKQTTCVACMRLLRWNAQVGRQHLSGLKTVMPRRGFKPRKPRKARTPVACWPRLTYERYPSATTQKSNAFHKLEKYCTNDPSATMRRMASTVKKMFAARSACCHQVMYGQHSMTPTSCKYTYGTQQYSTEYKACSRQSYLLYPSTRCKDV